MISSQENEHAILKSAANLIKTESIFSVEK